MLDNRLRTALISPGTVTHLDNCFGDLVGKVIAMIGVARRTSFEAIAQESALNQHGGIYRVAQDAEIRHMHATIHRIRESQQLTLDSLGEVECAGEW